MALSVTSRPSGFRSPHNGDLYYRFLENAIGGKNNYKLTLTLYTIVAGVPVSLGITGIFTPDASGIITCNISELCMKVLGFNSLGDYVNSIESTTPTGPRQFEFITMEYSAAWDSGNYSTVTDYTNRFIVFQGVSSVNNAWLETDGSINYTGLPLILEGASDYAVQLIGRNDHKFKAWTNRRTCIDFVVSHNSQFKRMLVDLGADDDGFGHAMTTRQVGGSAPITKYGFDYIPFTPKRNTNSGSSYYYLNESSTAFDIGTFVDGDSDTYIAADRFGQTFTPTNTGQHVFHFVKPEVVGSPTKRLLFKLWSTAAGNPSVVLEQKSLYIDTFESPIVSGSLLNDLSIQFQTTLNSGTVYAVTIEIDLTTSGVYDIANEIKFKWSTGGYAGGSLKYFQAGVWNTVAGQDFIMRVFQINTVPSEVVQINVVGECENPVYLTWINDQGGRSHYMFDKTQDMVFNFNTFRNQMFTIYAYDMVYPEWLMVQELNKLGTRVNSYEKVGSIVLDLSKPLISGNAQDTKAFRRVYVNPSQQRIRTKQQSYYAQLVIEYKEIPQNFSSNSLI